MDFSILEYSYTFAFGLSPQTNLKPIVEVGKDVEHFAIIKAVKFKLLEDIVTFFCTWGYCMWKNEEVRQVDNMFF